MIEFRQHLSVTASLLGRARTRAARRVGRGEKEFTLPFSLRRWERCDRGAARMLEVLFDDDDSSGSEDAGVPNGGRAGPFPNAQSSGSQPQWQQHVADELTALHAALETRARALNEREAALTERETRLCRRETQLASDDGLLRAVLEKESSRLLADAQVPASTLRQPWPRCCLRRGHHAPYPHGSTQLG